MPADEILIGIEQEFFVFHSDGEAPGYDTADAVFLHLLDRLGGELIASWTGHIYGLKCWRESAPLAIKHEMSTHILEVAFPPVRTPAAFYQLFDDVFMAIGEALSSAGLRIVAGGMLEQLPRPAFPSVAANDLPGIERRNIWPALRDTGDPLFAVDFPATISSTQVNLSVPNDLLIPRLPRYYAMEYLTPLLFSTSAIRRPVVAHCGRLVRYDACMPGAFRIIPEPMSPAMEIYRLGGRGYSAIVPKGAYAEFRTACSQSSASRIVDLAALRLLQHAFAMRNCSIPPRNSARIFREVCRAGFPEEEFLGDLKILEACLSDLPRDWRDFADDFLSACRTARPAKT